MSSTTNSKTLYTPVFFSSSEPPRGSRSTTSADLKVPSAYLNALSRTHIALAQIVQEVPSSRPGSPTEDADGSYPDSSTKERVSALRARIQEARAMADGNTADGKWTLLTHLLRMSVTSGKAGRWAGARADLKAPDIPDGGWINAVTEAEWAEWERNVGLKDKVENWKMRLETHEELDSQIIKDTQHTANEPSSNSEHQEEVKISNRKADRQIISIVDQVASTSKPTLSTPDSTPILAAQPKLKLKAVSGPTSESAVPTSSNSLKDNSLFGFAVVKRSNPPAASVGKKPPVKHVDSKPVNQAPEDTDTAQAVRKIVDIPETSFLPPSFPSSQLMTSTPNAKPISSDKRKPEPIPFTASPSLPPFDGPAGPAGSPLSSPRVIKVYGPLEKSISLPAIPSATSAAAALLPLPPPVPTTPTRNRDDTTNDNKRLFYSADGDVEHDRAVKRARTLPPLDSSSVVARLNEDGTNPPLPTTPKRQNLPTLTELLASAKKGKKKPHSPKGLKPLSAVGAGVDSSTTKPTSNKSKFRFPSPLPLAPGPLALEDNPYILDPYAISVNHHSSTLELGIDPDLSPTKSLSSLAGSDSEDEDEDEDDELKHQALGLDFSPSSFNPYATSTQHQNYPDEGRKGLGAVLSSGFGGYNSQFDVAGEVDKVDKLLEKDVDYEGWLRDPSLERDGARVEESP